jgi:hypothetical protein
MSSAHAQIAAGIELTMIFVSSVVVWRSPRAVLEEVAGLLNR